MASNRNAASCDNLAELMEQLGDVSLGRVLLRPPPGTATEEDAIDALEGINKRLCELVDGVLVEKALTLTKSLLEGVLIHYLGDFVRREDLGILLGPDGGFRLFPGSVRLPDVSFVRWNRLPGEKVPDVPLLRMGPDLAVDVLGPGNTKAEMDRKVSDYFRGRTRMVWVIDMQTRAAAVYTSPTEKRRIAKGRNLGGGAVLPGLSLPVADLFGEWQRRMRRPKS
jgi:Uma2 family endonuclease